MSRPRNRRGEPLRRPRAAAPAGRGGEHPLLQVRLAPWRSRLMMGLFFVAFAGLAVRAFWLQGGVDTEFLLEQGERRYARTIEVPANRGNVTDRNGVVLAASLPARAVWALPDQVKATPAQLAALAAVLRQPAGELRGHLEQDARFVHLARQLEPEVAQAVAALKIPGVHSNREFRRHYPEGPVGAQVVGITGIDGRGREGVELAFDRHLQGRAGMRRVITDRYGRVVDDDWLREPIDGRDLRLTIDHRLQYIAHSALRAAVERHQARAGAAVMLDVRSGEVLAMANWPAYDPNRLSTRDAEALRNRVLTDTFEPGSTIKPFAVATALEAGAVRPDTVIQTAPGWMLVGRSRISDSHPHGALTVAQVVARSSNVGVARIALGMPAQPLWDLYTAVGFGQPPRIGFPGAVAGRLRPAHAWLPIEHATIAYGYNLSVSLMQLARAYLVFARDGDLVPVTLVPDEGRAAPAAVQVIRPETARAVRAMLELAVSDEGTAPAARFAGWRVAGKTGTARKFRDGRYVKEYVASFAGFAPAHDPRIVVAVMIDEPAARYYGGEVAAPVFAQIAASALRTLQVPPETPRMVALQQAPAPGAAP